MKKLILASCVRLNVNVLTSFLAGRENHNPVNEGKESMILTHTDIKTGMMDSTTLAFDDVTGFTVRTTKNFHSKSFAF